MELKMSKKYEDQLQRREILKRLLSVFMISTFILYIIYEISPLFQPELSDIQLRQLESVTEIEREAKSRIDKPGEKAEQTGLIHLNSLLSAKVTVVAYGAEERIEITDRSIGSLTIRYDKLILLIGTASIIFLVLVTALNSVSGLSVLPDRGRDAEGNSAKRSTPSTAEEILENEVLYAQKRSEELFSRSTLLLSGGIIMAFIGVGIFYVSLPDMTTEKILLEDYLAHSIRPAGVLVFVEAIAWFLLRQYRNLIEDYKTFHRMYLKRANYLISFKALESHESADAGLLLVTSLLNEDLSGKLFNGETTESLETQKIKEDNPIFSLVSGIINQRKSKTDEK